MLLYNYNELNIKQYPEPSACAGFSKILYSQSQAKRPQSRTQPQNSILPPTPLPYFLPNTSLVSSSFPNSPRFRIAPALGASSLGCLASAFRYAACSALVFAACCPSNAPHRISNLRENRLNERVVDGVPVERMEEEGGLARRRGEVWGVGTDRQTSFLWCRHS